MRSFDARAEPVDSGCEELVVAILNAFRTNMEDVSETMDVRGGEGAVACDHSPRKPRTSLVVM